MKKMIWWGFGVGSTIGGVIPWLWTLNPFSFSSVFLTAIGGLIGIWAGYKIAKLTGAS